MRCLICKAGWMVVLGIMLSINPRLQAEQTIEISEPLSPPGWALLQQQLLHANSEACRIFFDRYFDERGYLLCVERWGGDDGPDDAPENMLHWPFLHALGGAENVLTMYKHGWEGHLRQFTEAKTVDVPFARDGMYYKEFPVMFDWLHNSEGLTVFNNQGLSDPDNLKFRHRVRRYAGFYLNEDPGAPNYDPEHKIIRSMFNGSRGPLLRKATGLDWAGDPIEVGNRFGLRHGEESYEQMIAHFRDYNDIVGDHPSNLVSTTLALNGYMLDHEAKYKDWILEYVNAWRERMIANGNIIPSNIGLDGTIGGNADGKWYGGVYGWGFSVVIPQTGGLAHRNTTHLGFPGFMNAYLLTGDDRYLDPWRKQIDLINAQVKQVNGTLMYPHNYGDQGWYNFSPQKYSSNAFEIYYFSMQDRDRKRIGSNGWLSFLEGNNPDYPEQSLRQDLEHVRSQVENVRNDPTTPDTRLTDDSMRFNPASVRSLVEQMVGGLIGGKNRLVLHCRLRYFDPENNRAGLPQGVSALIDRMTGDRVSVTLVNTDPINTRSVVVQAGGYGEHHFVSVQSDGQPEETLSLNAQDFTVRLAPGAGRRMTLKMKRFVHQPRLAFPWNAR